MAAALTDAERAEVEAELESLREAESELLARESVSEAARIRRDETVARLRSGISRLERLVEAV